MPINPLSRAALLLFAVASILLFTGLSRTDLQGSTEPREAGVAAEMLQDGDYLLPRLNGAAFLEKPPLSYWLQSQSIRMLGYTNLAPRLPSIIAALASVMLLFGYAARLHRNAGAGLIAGLLLLTMASFWMNARTAGQDALLAFGVALSLLSFLRAQDDSRAGWAWPGYVAGLGIATLAKGVIGLAIPGVTIFAFLLVDAIWISRRLVVSRWLLPGLLAVLALIPIIVWLYALYRQHGIGAVQEVVWTNSVGRFAGSYAHGEHDEPIYYYVKNLPETFQPWTLLLWVALWQMRKTWRESKHYLFLLCWLIAPFVLLSLSTGKRPTYLLSLYPAAALLVTAYLWNYLRLQSDRLPQLLELIQSALLTGVAIAIAARLVKIHMPVVAAASGMLSIVALIYLWRGAMRGYQRQFLAAAVALLSVAYVGYGGFVLPRDAIAESARRMFDALPNAGADAGDIILFNPNERVAGAARFYAHRPVKTAVAPAELAAVWREHPAAQVLLNAKDGSGVTDFAVRRKFAYGKDEYWIVAKAASGT